MILLLLILCNFLSALSFPCISIKKNSKSCIISKYRIFNNNINNDNNDDLDLPISIQNFNKISVEAVKSILNIVYNKRPYAYFAALETIARVPYFSYTSVLHLYETLGWFRRKEYIQIHFAESWNELHHLLIMEELGGNSEFQDRFVAQHIAFFYYWIVVVLYIANPAVAYDLNKHVEQHAFATYDKYLNENESELKLQPAPKVAVDYYEKGDLYMFDAFQYNKAFPSKTKVNISSTIGLSHANDDYNDGHNLSNNQLITNELEVYRRPKVETLYDVFYNIRADEAEHANTMQILQRDICLRNRGSAAADSNINSSRKET